MTLVVKGCEEWKRERELKYLIRYRYGVYSLAERRLHNEERRAVWV
jgi:hypothetical protein